MRRTIARIGATGAGALLALGLLATAPAGASPAGHGANSQDSTCFTATGQTQGRSHSDPDGMSNGGADKPGCPGGFDADQDGNNGCGNDADREDDNNGNCGRKKPGAGGESTPAPTTSTSTSTTTTTTGPPTVTPLVEPGLVEPSDCQVDPKEATGCTTAAQVAGTGARLSVAGTGSGAGGAATPESGGAVSGTTGTAGTATASDTADTTTSTTAPGTEVLGETLSRPSALARTGAGVGLMTLLGVVLTGGGRLAVLARRLLRIG